MKLKININSNGYAYLPKELRDEGYMGEVDAMPNHFAGVIARPGATLRQIQQSLEVLLHDIQIQLDNPGREAVGDRQSS